ncbi:MAG: TolC family protein [Acidobacteriota bacterium]|nr:TolC family protein [Acidobacteriota bacterium]
MATSTRFWRLGVAVPVLILFLFKPAVCQETGGVSDGGQRPSPQREEATHFDYSNSHSFPNILSPYSIPYVPEPRLDNSRRLKDLIIDGKLMLALDDAIGLALENNLDIAVARYNLPIAQTDLLRAKAGGAARGVAGSYQSTTLFSGVLGGGVGGGGGIGGRGAGGILGGGINGVGSSSCCDPDFYVAYGWSNAITPLNYTVVSGVPIDTTHQAAVSAGFSQGFLTGTSLSVSESSSRLSSNTTTGIYNPEFVSGLSAGFSQHLLNGFGTRANSRFIRIARNDLKYSMSVFRQYVITSTAAVMSTYYDLLADQESIRVAQEGLRYAQKLLENNQAEAKIGAVAQYDVLRSQEEVALRQQDLLATQNTFSQDAQSLKAKMSKSFNEELATVEIAPSDRLPEPHADDVPALAEALREAASHRPEIEQAELNLRNQQVTIEAIHNSLLPSLEVFASYSLSGLGGALRPTFGNIFQNDFPNFSYGVSLSIPIRNRTAQADAARALLEQRQLQMKLQDAKNQAVWDVSKAVSAVKQAQDQLDATLNLATLARQVLDMQQQKFTLASATVEDVITAQRNLATGEGNVVKARATYAKALIQYEQATGTLLDRNNIALSEAVDGEVHRIPNIPGTHNGAN